MPSKRATMQTARTRLQHQTAHPGIPPRPHRNVTSQSSEKLGMILPSVDSPATLAINRAVDNPFYRLEQGSVHARVGQGSDPVFYQFESQLLRLIGDEGYRVFVQGSQRAYLDARPDKSVRRRASGCTASMTCPHHPLVVTQDFSLEKTAEDLPRSSS
jgi:hypothetical protein